MNLRLKNWRTTFFNSTLSTSLKWKKRKIYCLRNSSDSSMLKSDFKIKWTMSTKNKEIWRAK